MALILNIETTTEVCSVALSLDGALLAIEESFLDKAHASQLTPLIQTILNKNNFKPTQLDAIAVSKGPGSYTGLRIGVSVAKGLCYSLNKPLIGVSTLQTLSWSAIKAYQEKKISTEKPLLFCPMIDARRMEVYTAFYDINNFLVRDIMAEIITENSFNNVLENNSILFFGNGSDKCKPFITHCNAVFMEAISSSSKNMIDLSEQAFNNNNFEDIAYFEPFYLKEFIATTAQNKLF